MCAQLEVVFKDTSWTEILHVKARSHSTFFHGQAVSPSLMEKNYTSKNYFDNYQEVRATRKKLKKSQKQKKCYCFLCVPFCCWATCGFLFSAKRFDWSFCWYCSIIIDNNSKPACAYSQVVLTHLCLNVMWILYPKIKLTMNLYG